jgi:hypothetical protein
MARLVDQLSALKVAKLKEPGWYVDGAGLYLQVTGDGDKRVNKSWLYQYRFQGKQRQMGLGSVTLISLAEAREKSKAAPARWDRSPCRSEGRPAGKETGSCEGVDLQALR